MRILLLVIATAVWSAARAQDCSCPSGINNDNDDAPYRLFTFNSGKALGVCGYQSIELADTTFTKFSLFVCGEDKVIKEWNDKKSCRIAKVKDTLFVHEMTGLPLGQSFSTLWMPYYVHKYWFKDGVLNQAEFFRRDIARYNKTQVAQVLSEYQQMTPGSGSVTHMAKMLFWAAVSGSKDAESYLRSLPEKFGPFDAVVAEEYSDVSALYDEWKTKARPGR